MRKVTILLFAGLAIIGTSGCYQTQHEIRQAAYYSPVLEHAPQYAPYYPYAVPDDPYWQGPVYYRDSRIGYSK